MHCCSFSHQLNPLHGHSSGSRLKQERLLRRQGMAAFAMHEGFQHQLQLAQSGASSFIVQVRQACMQVRQACMQRAWPVASSEVYIIVSLILGMLWWATSICTTHGKFLQVPPDHVLAAAPGPDDLDRHATSSWEVGKACRSSSQASSESCWQAVCAATRTLQPWGPALLLHPPAQPTGTLQSAS